MNRENPNTHNRLVAGSNPAEPTYPPGKLSLALIPLFQQSRVVDIIVSQGKDFPFFILNLRWPAQSFALSLNRD